MPHKLAMREALKGAWFTLGHWEKWCNYSGQDPLNAASSPHLKPAPSPDSNAGFTAQLSAEQG